MRGGMTDEEKAENIGKSDEENEAIRKEVSEEF